MSLTSEFLKIVSKLLEIDNSWATEESHPKNITTLKETFKETTEEIVKSEPKHFGEIIDLDDPQECDMIDMVIKGRTRNIDISPSSIYKVSVSEREEHLKVFFEESILEVEKELGGRGDPNFYNIVAERADLRLKEWLRSL
jgi:hypothetical protein